jgi:hypothetical protein
MEWKISFRTVNMAINNYFVQDKEFLDFIRKY